MIESSKNSAESSRLESEFNAIGAYVASRVKDGETIGLGSGRTASAVIRAIGERIRSQPITVRGVPTSIATATMAAEVGITVLDPQAHHEISWAFDGADEVDIGLRMIKGRGGALFQEKVIAKRAGGLVVCITADKLVTLLGDTRAVPIEIVPVAVEDARKDILSLGAASCEVRASTAKLGPTITDHGNIILDARFEQISATLELQLKSITGVIETGIFTNLAKEVLVLDDGKIERLLAGGSRELVAISGETSSLP